MLSSRFAGIPISSSTIDGWEVPRSLIRGERTPRRAPARVAGFISEWWPASNRNGGRLQIGIGGRIASEFAALSTKAARADRAGAFPGARISQAGSHLAQARPQNAEGVYRELRRPVEFQGRRRGRD